MLNPEILRILRRNEALAPNYERRGREPSSCLDDTEFGVPTREPHISYDHVEEQIPRYRINLLKE